MNLKTFYDQKTILITGAASGIGRRFAERVAEEADVSLVLWDRNPDMLAELKKELAEKADVCIGGVDISDKLQVYYEAEHVMKEGLLPDVIINCAGVVSGKFFHEMLPEEIDSTIQINLIGSMKVVHAFLPAMVERGSGHLVNLASASGYIGNPRMSVYASSKWGVLGWSESLRIEMEALKTGIRVTAVCPSYIDTGMFDGVRAPRLVPLLKTDDVVNRMLKDISRNKTMINMPFMVRFVPFLKAVLPGRMFDRLAGNVLGVYRSMDTFEGRKPRSDEPS